MARPHRTMRGSQVNMDQLRIKHERTIAIGNMNINAGGDAIGPGGKVTKDRNQRIREENELHTMMPGKIPVATGKEQVEKRSAVAEKIAEKVRAAEDDRSAAEKILADADIPVVHAPIVEEPVVSEGFREPRQEKPLGGLAATLAAPAELSHEITDVKPEKTKKGVKRI